MTKGRGECLSDNKNLAALGIRMLPFLFSHFVSHDPILMVTRQLLTLQALQMREKCCKGYSPLRYMALPFHLPRKGDRPSLRISFTISLPRTRLPHQEVAYRRWDFACSFFPLDFIGEEVKTEGVWSGY